MVEVTTASIARDVADLREMLTATAPTYATNRRELRMPADTAPVIARFWETLGWCRDFEQVLVRPDDPDALGQMAALLEEWRAADLRGDGSYDRIFAQLPARYRVVAIDDEHVTIADETEAVCDPPLCIVHGPSTDAEDVFVERLGRTYLADVALSVVESVRLATHWKGSLVASPSCFEEVLPCLVPGSRRSESVWLLATAGAEPSGSSLLDLRAPTISALVSFFAHLGASSLVAWTPHVAPARRARRVPLPRTLRHWTIDRPHPLRFFAGALEGVPVMIVDPEDPRDLLAIYCDAVDLAAVDRWFATHRPTRMRDRDP